MENGDQYKFTTKKWLSPKGTWVNDTEGIVPDVESPERVRLVPFIGSLSV